jgi:integrase/recombinase XerC
VTLGAHLDDCRDRGLRPATIAQRRRTLARLARHLGHDPDTATAAELASWHHDLTATVGATARASYLSHVRSYYRWLLDEGARIDDPTVRLVRPRLHRRIPRPISDTAMLDAIDRAPDPVRSMLILAAYAGLRAGEIAGLCREHVLDDQDPPALVVLDGKGGSQRVIPASPLVLGALLPADPGPLFGAVDGHTVSRRCNRYLRSIGRLETLHQFRHSFGTRVYASCQDLRITQELLGHQSPATTAGYAGWSMARAVTAVLSL